MDSRKSISSETSKKFTKTKLNNILNSAGRRFIGQLIYIAEEEISFKLF